FATPEPPAENAAEVQPMTESSAKPEPRQDAVPPSPAYGEPGAAPPAERVVDEPATPNAVPKNEEGVAAPATAAPDMDELVARVLGKMNPEVLQRVTHEILKPVIEAIV